VLKHKGYDMVFDPKWNLKMLSEQSYDSKVLELYNTCLHIKFEVSRLTHARVREHAVFK